ncbi:hypothetical protein DM45_2555 [Burkholderia mallei]|nr:hypothetical protein DM45_2555 [Burkholderia mallei]
MACMHAPPLARREPRIAGRAARESRGRPRHRQVGGRRVAHGTRARRRSKRRAPRARQAGSARRTRPATAARRPSRDRATRRAYPGFLAAATRSIAELDPTCARN